MSDEEFTVEDSIAGVAAAITLNYDTLLEILQEHVKREYVGAVADVNPGATAYLDEEAAGIWDAAMKVVLNRYLDTVRPNPDVAAQLEAAMERVPHLQECDDYRGIGGDCICEDHRRDVAHDVLTALTKVPPQ